MFLTLLIDININLDKRLFCHNWKWIC